MDQLLVRMRSESRMGTVSRIMQCCHRIEEPFRVQCVQTALQLQVAMQATSCEGAMPAAHFNYTLTHVAGHMEHNCGPRDCGAHGTYRTHGTQHEAYDCLRWQTGTDREGAPEGLKDRQVPVLGLHNHIPVKVRMSGELCLFGDLACPGSAATQS
eukprot:1155329-Pelagomonas_calceolata.AAC.3